jgi:hypothetical protein
MALERELATASLRSSRCGASWEIELTAFLAESGPVRTLSMRRGLFRPPLARRVQ